ncbi:MAG: hypothetical protein ABIH88_02095, partial [Patescibacteria group bacterium]
NKKTGQLKRGGWRFWPKIRSSLRKKPSRPFPCFFVRRFLGENEALGEKRPGTTFAIFQLPLGKRKRPQEGHYHDDSP